MPEIAVVGGTAHPALAAGICADRGDRAARPGQQRHCLAVLPGRGAGQREPLHDESRINSARAAQTRKTSRPSGAVVHLVQGPEPGAAAAQPRPRLTTLQRYVTPSQAAVAALIASSDPDHRGR